MAGVGITGAAVNAARDLDAGPVRLVKGGGRIRSVREWFELAPPKRGAQHWKDCRSAKELARAWCIEGVGAKVPAAVQTLLERFRVENATVAGDPEAQVAIDTLRGEPPNLDLALTFTTSADDGLAVGVEAKADESFGELVWTVLQDAADCIAVDKRTNATTRVQGLSRALLPRWVDGLPHLGELRYQLLTGVAGTLAHACRHGAGRAVFMVHEFVCDTHTDEAKLRRNGEDLDRFVRRLTSGAVDRVAHGQLIGPIRVRGSEHLLATTELFVGKVRTALDHVSSHVTETNQ